MVKLQYLSFHKQTIFVNQLQHVRKIQKIILIIANILWSKL